MSDLLEYLVQKNLNQPEEELSPYEIAKDVFQRGDDFDPSLDPILRVQMSRLRLSLDRYYQQVGIPEYSFNFPKGSYQMEIRRLAENTADSGTSIAPLREICLWIQLEEQPKAEKLQMALSMSQSFQNFSLFTPCGLHPFEPAYKENIDLILDFHWLNGQWHFCFKDPQQQKILSNHIYPQASPEYSLAFQKIIKADFFSIWGKVTRALLIKGQHWISDFFELIWQEKMLIQEESIQNIQAHFKENRFQAKWPLNLKLVFWNWHLVLAESMMEDRLEFYQHQLPLMQHLMLMHPDNPRLQLINLLYQNKCQQEISIPEIPLEQLPLDMLESLAGLYIKNKDWKSYWNLLNTITDQDDGNTYIFITGAIHLLIDPDWNETIRSLPPLIQQDFYLHHLWAICTAEKGQILKSHYHKVTAYHPENDLDPRPILAQYFHPEDAEKISKLFNQKIQEME
ncbi:hypothetical protein [Persicobacter diffluens]